MALAFFVSCTPKLIPTYYYDSDWKISSRDSAVYYRIISYDSSHKPVGIVKDFYIDGQLQFEGKLLSEDPVVLDSTCTWYFQNGQVHMQQTFKNGEIHGDRIEYIASGQLVLKETIYNDQSQGMYLRYYHDGTPREKCNYSNGLIVDTCYEYHVDGKIFKRIIREVSGDSSIYRFHRWHSNGSLSLQYQAVDNIRFGPFNSFYDDGQQNQIEYYENGELHGKMIKYGMDGSLVTYIDHFHGVGGFGFNIPGHTSPLKVYGKLVDGHPVGTWKILESPEKLLGIFQYDSLGNLISQKTWLSDPYTLISEFSIDSKVKVFKNYDNPGLKLSRVLEIDVENNVLISHYWVNGFIKSEERRNSAGEKLYEKRYSEQGALIYSSEEKE